MALNVPRLARAQGRRRAITLRPIIQTQAQASDLAAIIMPAAKIWAEAINRIMAGYNPTPLVIDSPDQMQAAIDQTANEFLTRLVATISPSLRRFSVRLEQWHRTKWASAVLAGTGVDLSTVLSSGGTAETVETFVARNVALVRNISEQAQGRIADAVFRGYQQRLPAREVEKDIREAAGLARDRAGRVASDQVSKLSAALDRERQAEAGLDSFKWRHSGKLHPRQRHKERDGKVYKLTDPSLQGDMPGDAPFCGCRAQAWIPLMDEIG